MRYVIRDGLRSLAQTDVFVTTGPSLTVSGSAHLRPSPSECAVTNRPRLRVASLTLAATPSPTNVRLGQCQPSDCPALRPEPWPHRPLRPAPTPAAQRPAIDNADASARVPILSVSHPPLCDSPRL